MKKALTFIPLGIGISGAIIYIFNIINFRVINNGAAMLQILSTLRVYLYVSVAGFLVYAFVKALSYFDNRHVNYQKEVKEEPLSTPNTDMINEIDDANVNTYVPNYDYVPMYQKEVREEPVKEIVSESKQEPELEYEYTYCINCGEKILDTDKYCSNCGKYQDEHKQSILTPLIKNIINVLEIVILILLIYFLLNMLFDYKASIDSNFTSPFKIEMTK